MKPSPVILAAVAALTAFQASAQIFLQNPGFETGDTTGWTFTPAASGSYAGINLGSVSANSGSYYFSFGGSSADTLSQTVTLPSAGVYTVDFFLNNSESGPSGSDLVVSLGGTQVLHVPTSAGPFGWTEFSFPVSASGSPTLSFAGQSGGLISLDDVSITPVPEVGAQMFTGCALLILGLARFAKRS